MARSNTANGGNTFVDLVIHLVAEDTTSITLRAVVYLTSLNVSDSTNNLSVGGNWSRSGTLALGGVYNAKPVWYNDIVLGKAYGSNQTATVSMSWSSVEYWGTTLSASESYTFGPRPWDNPAAPTIGTTVRNNDVSVTANWTNNPTGTAPYSYIRMHRSTDGAGWVPLGDIPGSSASYTDTTTSTDHTYAYLAQVWGPSGGWASSAGSNTVQTSPFQPSSISAAKNASNNIDIAWVNASGLAGKTFTVEESQNSGASWSALASGLGSGVTTYTHTAPSTSVLHRYRVKAVTTSGLSSGWTAMTTDVQLAAPPNAPTGLGPSTIRDATDPVTLVWTHNPVDSSPQSGFQLRHRDPAAGGAWTTVTVASSVSSWVLPANTYTNPKTVEWQVATKGIDPGYGPFSASANAPTSTRPTTVISSPTAAAYPSSTLTAVWTYFDAESSVQLGREATLWNSAGTTIIEQKSGAGAVLSTSFATKLPDASSWLLKVRVQDSSGMWSNLASQAFSVTYALPSKPVIKLATWIPGQGAVSLQISNPAPGGAEVVGVYNDVWKSINGGAFELYASQVPLNTTITDFAPTVNGTTAYRVDTFSALPSQNSSLITTVTTPQVGDPVPSLWLSGGARFSQVCRAVRNIFIAADANLTERVLRQYAGRTKPLEHAGTSIARSWQVSADIIPAAGGSPGSPMEDWLALAVIPGPFLLRTPDGGYRYVSIAGLSANRNIGGNVIGVSFTATEVDR